MRRPAVVRYRLVRKAKGAAHIARKLDNEAYATAVAFLRRAVGDAAVDKGHFRIPRAAVDVPNEGLYLPCDEIRFRGSDASAALVLRRDAGHLVIGTRETEQADTGAFIADMPRADAERVWRTLAYLSRVRVERGEEILSNRIMRKWSHQRSQADHFHDWSREDLRMKRVRWHGYLDMTVYERAATLYLEDLAAQAPLEEDVEHVCLLVLKEIRKALRYGDFQHAGIESGEDIAAYLSYIIDSFLAGASGNAGALVLDIARDSPAWDSSRRLHRGEFRPAALPNALARHAWLIRNIISLPPDHRIAAVAELLDEGRGRAGAVAYLDDSLRYLRLRQPDAAGPLRKAFLHAFAAFDDTDPTGAAYWLTSMLHTSEILFGSHPALARALARDAAPSKAAVGDAMLYDRLKDEEAAERLRARLASPDAAIARAAVAALDMTASGPSFLASAYDRVSDAQAKREILMVIADSSDEAPEFALARLESYADLLEDNVPLGDSSELECMLVHIHGNTRLLAAIKPSGNLAESATRLALKLMTDDPELTEDMLFPLAACGTPTAIPVLESLLKSPLDDYLRLEVLHTIDLIRLRASSDPLAMLLSFDLDAYDDFTPYDITTVLSNCFTATELECLLAEPSARKAWLYVFAALAHKRGKPVS